MKRSFIFLSCLVSMIIVQAYPLFADCGCGKKKQGNQKSICFNGGCGCEGGGNGGSNEIPPDHE